MDERIFDQLHRLQRGARDIGIPPLQPDSHDSGAEYLVYSGYGGGGRSQHEGYVPFDEQPYDGRFRDGFELDPFDYGPLYQADHGVRLPQAPPQDTQLVLPFRPGSRDPHQTAESYPQHPSTTHRPSLAHFAFEGGHSELGSSSPQRQNRTSSPASRASRRQPATYLPQQTAAASNERPPLDGQTNHFRAGVAVGAHEIREYDSPPVPRSASRIQRNDTANPQNSKHRPPVVQGIDLITTRELPDKYRSIFAFPLFNAVQSKCFETVYRTNDNFVVSAPTGSGKTAVLELAICRLINGFTSGSFKVVYQAPTKSLCSERQRDWQAKFGPLDLRCAELTGDTDSSQLRNVQHASIIVTTPEKWDSMTRKWKDHQKLMQMVKLFLIDEVHILKESRGATLEAVVSRMKSVGSNVRFVALSATVPNASDVSTWLGKDTSNPLIPAPLEKFGEEFRPVRLQKHVCGYRSDSNDFAFDKMLNSKVTEVIAKWSQRKPIMVFCFTRNSCVETAKLLASWWSSKGTKDRYWSAPRESIAIADKGLRETVSAGVAVHHAGLAIQDRAAVEKGYLEGNISVICCTSTLAVGVNLPCHMVIIKNTISYTNNAGCKEYSDLEVMQMLGRAGRPQFDNSAVAVIMTRLHRVEIYEKMVSGQEVLESCLHLNLIDHLNSEIGLGTVTDISSAKKWLTGTFLYVRLKDNAAHYKLTDDAPGRSIDERLEHICAKAIALLQEHDLVQSTLRLQSTEMGDAMARYYLQFDTMKYFLALPPKAKISEILSAISKAAEFKDVRFRAGEKSTYKDLNKNISIKFPIPVNIEVPAHKVSLIIQSVLGGVELPTEDRRHHLEYMTNKSTIFGHVHRLIRCIIDCQLHLDDSISARNALMLARSFGAQVWDDSPLHLKQLEGIGLVYCRKLVATGITTIEDLEATEQHTIECTLSRNPPFGLHVQTRAREFPRLRICMKSIGEAVVKKGEGVVVRIKAEIGFINDKPPEMYNSKLIYVCFLADVSDGRKVHFARISARKLNMGQDVLFSAKLNTPGQTIRGFVMCDEVAGTQRTAMLKPEVPSFMFPTPKAVEEMSKQRPVNNVAPNTSKRRLEAATKSLQDDDEFGDAGINDVDLAAAAATAAASNDEYDFANIEDFDDSGNEKHKSKPVKKSKQETPNQTAEQWEPTRLDNGRWACKHRCKDKNKCNHLCCREGIERKPKPSKPKDDQASKKKDAGNDHTQTQLTLVKSKKAESQSKSTAPPTWTAPVRKATASKEARDLDCLHDSISSITKKVPLLKDQEAPRLPASTARAQLPRLDYFNDDHLVKVDTNSSERVVDMLDMTDLPHLNETAKDIQSYSNMTPAGAAAYADGDDEEMLDLSDHVFNENATGSLGGSGHADMSSFMDEFHGEDLHSHPPERSNKPVPNQDKGIFVHGDSSSEQDHMASHRAHATSQKHGLDDATAGMSDFPPRAKKQKPASTQLQDRPRPSVDDMLTELPSDLPADAEVASEQQVETREDKDKSLLDWFERELGTDLFNYTG